MSIDNPGVGVIITLWANENTLKAYAKGVFVATAGKLERFVTGPPEVKQFRAFSAEFKH